MRIYCSSLHAMMKHVCTVYTFIRDVRRRVKWLFLASRFLRGFFSLEAHLRYVT